jgi:hypothetical protein
MIEGREEGLKRYHISSRQILRDMIEMVKREKSIEESPVFGMSCEEDPKAVLRRLAY